MRIVLIAAISGSLLVAGCTTNPYTGERQASKAAIGALTGAAVGALAGGKKHRGEGAAIGAALGGGVGVYMDSQEKKLRDELQGTGVGVQKDKTTGAIDLIMPGNITFPTAQSSIKPDFFATLNSVGKTLKEFNKTTITVSGHTDNVGRDDYNMKLSQDRANAVGQYLTSQGVPASRITTVGFGKTKPIADNSNEVGRAQNRRVEITINPPESM
ncbi:MAG: OmpA family protein [Fluviicoccus sp.]|uniref:OmpA family protein n=1 Tax=Fluviicoccus sp. TaxID=2003552 RepID=UPI002724B561|nr:OmpA family protein [Fluviicoccus sp.]MDO8329395.1 OmpA family protein [Fluviicoccus sp.]